LTLLRLRCHTEYMPKRSLKHVSVFQKDIPKKTLIPILIGTAIIFVGTFFSFFTFKRLGFIAGEISYRVLSPFVHYTPLPSPTLQPRSPHQFTFTQTPLMTRLQKQQTRIVFTQESKTWMARLDGSDPISLKLPGITDNQPLSAITDGWIYYLVRDYTLYPTKILAYNYLTRQVQYISEPANGKYITEIAQTSIPAENDLILYKIAYVELSCIWKKKGACLGNFTAPGLRGGAFAYNPNNEKKTYLGDLNFIDYPRYPSVEPIENTIFAAKNNQYVMVNTQTGTLQNVDSPCYEGQSFTCIPVDVDYRINTHAKEQLILQGMTDRWVFENSENVESSTILLSPDHRNALYMQSKPRRGISYYLLDLTNHSSSEILHDYSNVVRCVSWVSNTTALCHQEDIHTTPVSYHNFLLNVFTTEKSTIVPGDSISF